MLTLYGINLSTFTRKARLALAEKGLEYRLEVAPMGSPKVRALHPLGKIPVLADGEVVVPDSSVIVAYLERAWPARPLYPTAAAGLARALWLEEYADTRLREATLPWFAENVVKPLFQGKPADESALAAAGAGRDECFDYLDGAIGGQPFAAGESFSIADVAIGAQLVTYQQGGGGIPVERWPNLAGLMARLRARPAWAGIIAEEEAALAAARARRAGA